MRSLDRRLIGIPEVRLPTEYAPKSLFSMSSFAPALFRPFCGLYCDIMRGHHDSDFLHLFLLFLLIASC